MPGCIGLWLLVWTMAFSAGQTQPEATSLLGKPLARAPLSETPRQQLEANLAAAQAVYDKNPDDADAIIWLGRRTAYLGRYREAIAIFTKGLEKHPADPRMYRHRGHRYITLRELDRAVADFSKAATLIKGRADEIEPDGQPNARNIPTSTLNTNVYYHLGLAYYLKGEFDPALPAYRECLRFSKNPDMLVATTHWLYMTLRRLNRPEDARALLEPITADMDIIENKSYYELLMMYKRAGDQGPGVGDLLKTFIGLDAVTIGYGVANWNYYNGRREQAVEQFTTIVDAQSAQWPAFGYIASEAELARVKR
jgi:tetratricopeptide (TPR) repeat protein